MARGQGLVAAVALAGALATAPGAAARPQVFDDVNVPVSVTGGVTVVWRANPAACSAAGLCGFSGSATISLAGSADAEVSGTRGHAILDSVDLLADNPGVVRARREGPDGSHPCVDTTAPALFANTEPAANGRVSLPLAGADNGALLSSGRCGGPLPADLPAALVSRPVDSRRLGVRPVAVDLSGRAPIRPGAFNGEVISTLRLTVGRAGRSHSQQNGYAEVRSHRLPRTQVVLLDYAVDGVSGAVSTTFAGLPGPGCAPLDSCGVLGSVDYSLDRAPGTVHVLGHRRVHGGGGGLGFALLALRQGRMHARIAFEPEDNGDTTKVTGPTGTTTERMTLPDGTVCRDSVTGDAPPFGGEVPGLGARALVLGPADQPGIDVLRTRCPGPAEADAVGAGGLAVAAPQTASLGRQEIDLPLRAGGAFAGPGYAGSRSGQIVLHLSLSRARAEVVGR
jgi:hypothetical protein